MKDHMKVEKASVNIHLFSNDLYPTDSDLSEEYIRRLKSVKGLVSNLLIELGEDIFISAKSNEVPSGNVKPGEGLVKILQTEISLENISAFIGHLGRLLKMEPPIEIYVRIGDREVRAVVPSKNLPQTVESLGRLVEDLKE